MTTQYTPPNLYSRVDAFAEYLVQHFECSQIIHCGPLPEAPLPDVKIVRVDPVRDAHPDPALLSKSVIVYRIENVDQPEQSLATVKHWLDHAPVALLATPERGLDPNGGRWTQDEFKALIQTAGLRLEFSGLAPDQTGRKHVCLAVVANNHRPPVAPAPADFHVVAIMRVYNEADIVVPAIRYLTTQGIDVYVIDNWSTDGSYEMVQALMGQGVIGAERFPPDGPPKLYQHKQLLERIERVSQIIDADWLIHHDVDECREAPWPDVTLRDAFYHVDRCGFSAINFATLNFYPVDAGFQPGTDFKAYFTRYEMGRRGGHLLQHKAWKNTGQKIALVPSGGHHVQFKGKRVYPYRFLLRHYPLRLPEQTIRKIDDRQNRVPRVARLLGWHHTYDAYDPEDTRLFDNLCDWARAELETFDPEAFYRTYLIERLSSVGLQRPASHKRRSPLLRPLVPVLRTARGILRRRLI